MYKALLYLLLCVFSATIQAQENSIKYLEKVKTLDSTISTLYSVVSGDKGEERDWELFKFLFTQDAKLIPSRKNEEGFYVTRYMSPSDYISTSSSWLEDNGFFEKEIHRTTNHFGNMAHVFSTYASFQKKTDTIPFMRGINSIQLLYDGSRWWVVNIFWTQETPENPIPLEYLPKD